MKMLRQTLQITIVTLMVSVSHAAQVDANKVAKSVAAFMNYVGTYNQFLDLVAKNSSTEDVDFLKAQFTKLAINLDSKFPVAAAEGNKVKLEGLSSKLEISSNGEIKFKLKTYKFSGKGKLSDYVQSFVDDLNPQTASLMLLFLPRANAGVLDKSAAIGGMIVTYVAAFQALNWAGATYSLGTGFGMVGLPLLALGGMVWLGVEIYQTIYDGEVSCQGKYFVARKKTRAMGIVPTSEQQVIDIDQVKTVLNMPQLTECKPEIAKQFQKSVKKVVTVAMAQQAKPTASVPKQPAAIPAGKVQQTR